MLNSVNSAKTHSFLKLFNSLCSGKYQPWDIWSDFIYMTAAAISNKVDISHFDKRESSYFDIIEKYTREEAKFFQKMYVELVGAMEHSSEQDFLGSLYMQLNLGNHWKGQFFTPYELCRCMAEMDTLNFIKQIEKKGYITINDPACGAGATLIAFANSIKIKLLNDKSTLNWQNHILFIAQDVDMVTGLMCYIQLSLLGCAGYVKIDNSLSSPIRENDDLTNYWFTPMYFSEVWHYRRIFHSLDTLINNKARDNIPKKMKKGLSVTDYSIELKEKKTGQLSLF